MKLTFSTLLSLCLLLAVGSDGLARKPASPFISKKPKILVLHSYHHGFTWSDNISSGIRTAFAPYKELIELRFEFMDTRRYVSPDYLQGFHQLLYTKYAEVKPDLVIASDDNALAYLLDQGQGLFKDIPVVFCSVSGYQPWMREGRSITGVQEAIDIRSTLDVALKLHPDTESVAVITDTTRTGRALKGKAARIFGNYRNRVAFTYLEDLTIDELAHKVAELKSGSIIFLFIFSKDKEGRVLSHEQNLSLLSKFSKVPIYSVWKFYLGFGITGGKLSSGEAEGRLAADMALRILRGERATDIPLETSPLKYMFDAQQLKRFGIDTASLPPESLVFNRTFSFYEQYKQIIWAVIGAFALLFVIMAVLIGNIAMRQKAEVALRESEEKFSKAFMVGPDVILITRSSDGAIIDANEQFFKTTGYVRQEVIGKSAADIQNWVDPSMRDRFVRQIEQFGQVDNMEVYFRMKDGQTLPFLISARPIEVGGQQCIISNTRDISQRKRYEEALKESEQRLRMVIDHAAVIIWAVDKNGVFTFSEGRGLEKLGLKGGEVVGRSLFEMYAEQKSIVTGVRRVLAGESFSSTTEIADMVFENSYVPLFDQHGQIDGAIGVSIDVTERKRDQLALLASEQKFRNIVESSPMGMHLFEMTEDGRLILTGANPAADAILGVDNSQFVGKTIEDIFPALKGTELPAQFRRVCSEGSPWHTQQIEYREKRIRVAFEVYAFQTAPGMMAAFFLDVTERKRAEEALKDSEERFREIAAYSRAVFWLFDWVEQRVIYVSPAYESIWGRSVDSLYQRYEDWADSIHPDDMAYAQASFDEILETGGGEDRRYRIVRPDGSIRWVSDRGYAIKKADGSIVRITGIAEDITEQTLAAEDKRRLEAQLIQAQKMEAIGTLAGGIAHDFNNLLMGIQGRTSLMRADSELSFRHEEHLQGIENYVKDAVDLTRQLLGFARGGKYEVVPTNLNDLVKGQNRMFGRTTKEVAVHGKYKKDLWSAEVDQGQVKQVLLNLYVNAWQAMPAGGDIYVQTDNVELDETYTQPFEVQPGRYVKISVTDTGTGIDHQIKQRIFEPFFTTKEMGRGTGLGLASVYGIVKNHGGFINVYSEKGEGTTFNIYLPATETAYATEVKQTRQWSKGEGTVLLVDDEQMILDVGCEMIELLGYKAMAASDGKEALAVYADNQSNIDVVVLDMVMPRMSGGETFDELKKINPEVKVILSSGYSINGKASEILQRGCKGFIQKPFNLSEISEKIKEVMAN